MVEAAQYHFDNQGEVIPGVCTITDCPNNMLNGPHIHTLEGVMNVGNGDWVIKGIKGEYYPCKPDIFEKTYQKAE